MLEVWLPLLSFALLGWTWYHVLRLRERAVLHARQLCERHGVQLLDDSVSLHRLHANWRNGALQVMREYRFDTSLDGHDRQSAGITLLGNHVVGTSLPSRDHIAGVPPSTAAPVVSQILTRRAAVPDNVIPFDRERRTLH